MRHTKIIATVGPASDADTTLDALIAAGADIMRLNFSHGTHQTQAATFDRVRRAAQRARREVAVLQDLGGPKIRSGRLEGGRRIVLTPGDRLRIATGDFVGGPGRISTTFADLARSVHPGDRLLLAAGHIELRVESTDGQEIVATVVEGGVLGEQKGINAPGVPLPASAITPKDVQDLKFGLALGVDMIALSFVHTAADLRHARQLLAENGSPDVPLVAKLERPQALDHLDDIIAACDAVMVARGDLGLEMPLERVPRAQKEITRAARRRGIPVILATQVLESMTTEARPTRAEVSDAANAVNDGVDAIMLAGETAAGLFPARAVQALDAIVRDAETSPVPPSPMLVAIEGGHAQAICEAAVTLANRGEAQAIVAVTRGGVAAVVVSVLRSAVHRAVGALETVSSENRAAIHARARQLLNALTLLAYGVAAIASISFALARLGVGDVRWDPRLVGRWVIVHAVNVAIIVIGAYVVIRAANLGIAHLQYKLGRRHAHADLEWQRRAATLGGILTSLVTASVVFLAILMLLRELSIDVLPILTGAGIAGLAIGFGAQNLVRDVISGFFLILEDQVRVGDIARINGIAGTVEQINLRTIVLRDVEGAVQMFPNGTITSLANLSKQFAYAVVDVRVAYSENMERVLGTIREVGAVMERDPAWGSLVLGPLEILGVESLADGAATVQAKFKTLPLNQGKVANELRKRLMTTFASRGIKPYA